MLILMMFLIALFAVLVIMFLIQYRSYNLSHKKILSAAALPTEERDTTSDEPSGLQLALKEEATGYAT